jgi:hypothetical protein
VASPDAAPAVIDVAEPMGSVNNIVPRLDGIETTTADGGPLIAVVTSNESFAPGASDWADPAPRTPGAVRGRHGNSGRGSLFRARLAARLNAATRAKAIQS